jgi:xanthine dehydrogenase accessory factor
MSELEKVLEAALRLEREGEPGAMLTLIDTGGSTPRHGVARMVLRPDGSSVGTIGGGAIEHAMMQRARQVIDDGAAVLETTTLQAVGMTCGGRVQVLIEPVGVRPALVIFGAGHVGAEVAPLAARCGFIVDVVDDRPEFASKERFPDARRLVHSFDPAVYREALRLGPSTFCVVVTRGHEHDFGVVRALVELDLAYLGLMGSSKKVREIRARLAEGGVAEAAIERLRAPIGLKIGSETPAELAVSIVGELIQLRRDAPRP